MAQVITVTNQKGGTGKTSTVSALCSGLTKRGYKTLTVDLDAQCNLTYALGIENPKKTALGLLMNEVQAQEAIIKTDLSGDVIASSKDLSGADLFINGVEKEYRLSEALEPVAQDYDFILIDTPPQLSVITVNALTASNYVLIPCQADIFSLLGLSTLFSESINPVKKYSNHNLNACGILLTKYVARTTLSKDISDFFRKIATQLNTKVFNTYIRESVTIREAQVKQLSVFDYAPKSPVADDYNNFIEELLKTIQEDNSRTCKDATI